MHDRRAEGWGTPLASRVLVPFPSCVPAQNIGVPEIVPEIRKSLKFLRFISGSSDTLYLHLSYIPDRKHWVAYRRLCGFC